MSVRERNVAAVGLLVLLAAGVLVWGGFFLLGAPMVGGGTPIVVMLEDGGGLKRGDRVQLQGVTVGTVREVVLSGPARILADVRIDDGIQLPSDTRAAVLGDVFGAHTVELLPGTALVRLEAGDTIRGTAAAPIPRVMTELSDRAQSVLDRAAALLAPGAVEDVHATASVLPATARELQGALAELHRTAIALRRSAEAVEAAQPGPALGRAIAELESGARAFAGAARSMDRSLVVLESVLGKIDRGEGTLGQLVNDPSLYQELHAAIRDVRALTADIREHPRRYFEVSVF